MPKKKSNKDKLADFDTSKILSGNKSYMSLAYGAVTVIVIFVIIFLGVRAISQRNAEISDQATQTELAGTTYVVAEGDNLWTIAEDVYDDGFKWTVIAEANNLDSPDDIETGMELIIPNLTPTIVSETSSDEDAMEIVNDDEVSDEETMEVSTVMPSESPIVNSTSKSKGGEGTGTISSATYTVVEGDHLWGIAVRAYGDGFRWVEIAQTNNINNPDLIYPGEQFKLPR
jgi:nucleoid-associated protein YgaU